MSSNSNKEAVPQPKNTDTGSHTQNNSDRLELNIFNIIELLQKNYGHPTNQAMN